MPVAAPADVWALGASLFWCWTGQRPIAYRDPEGERAGKLCDIADVRLLDLTVVRPFPCPELEEAIRVCLHPDPARRPTAAELSDLIRDGEVKR